MSQKYSEEYYTLKAELAKIKEQLSASLNAGGRAQRFVKLTERYADFAELTPAILNEFISKIEVHERDQKRARYAIQHIRIYFNHIGKFENKLTQLAEPTEQEIRQMREEIEVTNQKLRQLKARISKLQDWLKEEAENTEPPTLADCIQGILSRKAQAGKPGYSQSLYNLKDAAKMLNFLQANNIMDMTGLDEKFKSMIGEQLDIQGKLKPVERRRKIISKA